ncbi:ankyrin repeat domain-containing protein [bacterium]|nr:ankyrin repeat domain-containing protein [Candidatus Omnitrophota bacterium]MBU2528937.1 ankyrin repeat domain-containing protein [bacterium]MBU3930691.1 ankyrin repeat domain-containing protein [bacterium]MBU4123283.1 ankyrin repeat domain-containing protein [bacterium]
MTLIKRFAVCSLIVFCAQGVFAAGISSAILKRDDAKRLEREIKKSADINDCDWFGRTALMRAIRFNALDCAELLIANGAGIDTRDKNGWTALIWASVECSTSAVKMLLAKGADPHIHDNLGYTALMFAEDKNSDVICAMLRKAVEKSLLKKEKKPAGGEGRKVK